MRDFFSFTLHVAFHTNGFIPACFPQMLRGISFTPVRSELCSMLKKPSLLSHCSLLSSPSCSLKVVPEPQPCPAATPCPYELM